jgi:hypothetical protein
MVRVPIAMENYVTVFSLHNKREMTVKNITEQLRLLSLRYFGERHVAEGKFRKTTIKTG